MFNFTPFPYLSTERLTLRPMTLEDENEIFVLRSDEEIIRYIQHTRAKTIDDVRDHINRITNIIATNEGVLWGMSLKDETKLIGTICLFNISKENNTAEIGYVIHKNQQGKGLMQEAVNKVLDYGFNDLKLSAIEACVDPKNLRSVKLLERNGFSYKEDLEENLVAYTLRSKV